VRSCVPMHGGRPAPSPRRASPTRCRPLPLRSWHAPPPTRPLRSAVAPARRASARLQPRGRRPRATRATRGAAAPAPVQTGAICASSLYWMEERFASVCTREKDVRPVCTGEGTLSESLQERTTSESCCFPIGTGSLSTAAASIVFTFCAPAGAAKYSRCFTVAILTTAAAAPSFISCDGRPRPALRGPGRTTKAQRCAARRTNRTGAPPGLRLRGPPRHTWRAARPGSAAATTRLAETRPCSQLERGSPRRLHRACPRLLSGGFAAQEHIRMEGSTYCRCFAGFCVVREDCVAQLSLLLCRERHAELLNHRRSLLVKHRRSAQQERSLNPGGSCAVPGRYRAGRAREKTN